MLAMNTPMEGQEEGEGRREERGGGRGGGKEREEGDMNEN